MGREVSFGGPDGEDFDFEINETVIGFAGGTGSFLSLITPYHVHLNDFTDE